MSRIPRGLLVFALALLSLGASTEAKLRDAVKRGNDAWITAGRTLKKEALEPFFAGDAFNYLSEILATSKQDGVYMELVLVKVDYRNVSVEPGGKLGSVAVSEYWRVTWRHLGTDECEVILKPRERRQTYRLQKTDGAWKIIGINEEPNLPPIETEECPA